MARRRHTVARSEPVCAWCRDADTTMSPYRTPLEDSPVTHGTVGRIVCSPACPSRPPEAVCFRRQYNGPPSTRPEWA